MRKCLIVSNVLTLFLLGYYAVTKGVDIVIGLALAVSVASNVLNSMCEVKYGREKD